MKKNTLGTLFIFEVIRFQKNLLNLKEHPIPSLGLPVVLHRESFCVIGPSGHNAKHYGSEMGPQAAPLLSPCVFVYFRGAQKPNASLVITMRAWARLSPYAFALRATPCGSDIGLQAILHHSPFRCLCYFCRHSGLRAGIILQFSGHPREGEDP